MPRLLRLKNFNDDVDQLLKNESFAVVNLDRTIYNKVYRCPIHYRATVSIEPGHIAKAKLDDMALRDFS